MTKQVILITGANGQLGSELQALQLQYPRWQFIGTGHQDLPIEQAVAVNDWFEKNRPAYVINAAAYTAVDKAESDRQQAFLINAEGAANLAAACKKYGARLVHISTDYVFNGSSAVPYTEDQPTDPVNIYGASKLKGEQACLTENPGSIVIRTAWVYSSFGNNFVKTMLRLMKERPSLNVVSDQVGAPTYAADLAAAILQIISRAEWLPGIYHYSNQGRISWYEFALAIKKYSGSACEVNPIPSAQYPTPARRPAFSLLNTEKIRNSFHLSIPDWEESLKICLHRLNAFADHEQQA